MLIVPALGETAAHITSNGIYVVQCKDGQLSRTTVYEGRVDKVWLNGGDDDKPPQGDLTARTKARAQKVGEPSAALKFAANYQAGATLMTRDGATWAAAKANVDALNTLVISQVKNQGEWTAFVVVTDKDLEDEPKTAATFEAVAEGCNQAAANNVIEAIEKIDLDRWIKLITCFLEIYRPDRGDGMLKALTAEPTPATPAVEQPKRTVFREVK